MYLLYEKNGRVMGLSDIAPVGVLSVEWADPLPQCGEDESLYYVDGVVVARKQGPTKAEQEAHRASAYRERVDPITCEIQRLRDMGGTEAEIAEAEQRRAEAVQAVKDEYPYPQEGEK